MIIDGDVIAVVERKLFFLTVIIKKSQLLGCEIFKSYSGMRIFIIIAMQKDMLMIFELVISKIKY